MPVQSPANSRLFPAVMLRLALSDSLDQHVVCAIVVVIGNLSTVGAYESMAQTQAVVELAAHSTRN